MRQGGGSPLTALYTVLFVFLPTAPLAPSSTMTSSRLPAEGRRHAYLGLRKLSTGTACRPPVSRRAMLYVPGSTPRMLEKSLASPADSVCYDLEDAVAPGKKADARRSVCDLLNVNTLDDEMSTAIDGYRATGDQRAKLWRESMPLGLATSKRT